MFDVNKFKSGLRFDEADETYKFLENIIPYLKNIKLANNKKVFSFDGMVQTIIGILFIIKSLAQESLEVQYILTSRLNQDALENTFALIRCANGNNFNPSVQEFSFTIAKLLSIKYLTSFTTLSNCEEDNDSNLLNVLREEIDQEQATVNEISIESKESMNDLLCNVSNDNDYDEMESESTNLELIPYEPKINSDAPTRYFVGYLIQRVLKKFNCVSCALEMVKENDYLECTSELLIHHRNYLNDTFGKLHTPSQSFFELCKQQIELFEQIFKSSAHTIGLKQQIVKTLLGNKNDCSFYDKDHSCFGHRLFLLNLMILILIRKHSKWNIERIKKENLVAKNTKKQTRTKRASTSSKDKRWRTILN